jgi:Glycosyl transferase family 2
VKQKSNSAAHVEATSLQRDSTTGTSCLFSILIGRVSTEDGTRILETLEALRAQEGRFAHEVIVADRLQDPVSERIRTEYPEIQLLPCPADTSLPELRTRAFEKACGDYIVVTEDHCVPSHNWLAALIEAFQEAPAGTVAVGGLIDNGVCDTLFDRATFFCEYNAFAGSIRSGPARALPGMNVAYRRSAIAALNRGTLAKGFWETTVHPIFLENGSILYLSDRIKILHKKKFSFGLFAVQRFLYSRYYAGLRFRQDQLLSRWAMSGLTLALPPLLLFRMTRNLLTKKPLIPDLIRALPYLTLFVIICAWGEFVGYIAGPGDALSRIE